MSTPNGMMTLTATQKPGEYMIGVDFGMSFDECSVQGFEVTPSTWDSLERALRPG